jgi:hypothetical protein
MDTGIVLNRFWYGQRVVTECTVDWEVEMILEVHVYTE